MLLVWCGVIGQVRTLFADACIKKEGSEPVRYSTAEPSMPAL
jgi:hypothetical protein